MSTWRCLALGLVACSSSAVPKAQPSSSPGAPESSPAAVMEPATVMVAANDPACVPPEPPASAEPVHADDTTGDGDDGDALPANHKRLRPDRIDACSVSSTNLARDAAAIVGASDARSERRAAPRTPWNHRATPERLDVIRRRFELDTPELAQLGKTGVVVPARLEQPSYAYAYHEIFQSQLPVYITADSLFHAIFASHDALVARLESESIAPALEQALDRMHCALPAASADYPADTI